MDQKIRSLESELSQLRVDALKIMVERDTLFEVVKHLTGTTKPNEPESAEA